MSPAASKDQKPARSGSVLTTSPTRTARSMRTSTLALLVVVDVVVAATMLGSTVRSVVAPDQAVKAGPMHVVLAFMTVSTVLMAFLAVNATFYPMVTRRRVADLSLVMWTAAAVGTVVGILTLGGAVNSLVMRLSVGSIAYAFIWMQASRIEKARAMQASARQSGGAGTSAPAARPAPPKSKSRQRRGGRKH